MMEYELLGHVTHVSDHSWSTQLSNFAKHEKNPISGKYEAHKVDIPIPVRTYIKVEKRREQNDNKVVIGE